MWKECITLIKKYEALILYLFFGALTTAVNYAVYLPLFNLLHWQAAPSNAASWFVAVIFAFVTNKKYVFHSGDWSWKCLLPEIGSFFACRLGSGVLETVFLLVTVDILSWNGNWMKVITSILVIVLNYFGSKFLVFRNKKQ